MSDLHVTGLQAALEANREAPDHEWRLVPCAKDGCDNLAESLFAVTNHGQGELFPEIEPVFCDGCLDAMADEHEAEFGWMRSF